MLVKTTASPTVAGPALPGQKTELSPAKRTHLSSKAALTAGPVEPLRACHRASLADPSSCSWQSKPFWEGQLGSRVESVRKANGKRAKAILKARVGSPVTREVTEMVLVLVLWKHLPLIGA